MSEELETVDIQVTPSLHPRNVHELDGYDEETASILSATEAAFTAAYDGIGFVHTARQKAATNPTWNEAQQILETAALADKQFTRIAKGFDNAAANLKTIVASIEQEFAQPIESKASGTVAAEIRAHAKGLDTGKRMTFARAAILDNDQRTATALLGAPAYLSGLAPEMQTVLTRMYHEHHQPLQAKRLKAAQAGLSLIGERAGLVFSQLERATGASNTKVAKLRAAKNAAEQAFVLQDA